MLLPMMLCLSLLCTSADAESEIELCVPSSLDGSLQSVLLIPAPRTQPAPLLVLLHWWSASYDSFDTALWRAEAAQRGWHLLLPDFRGPNVKPEACASPQARQDILDAVDFVVANYPVDSARIYLAGTSGGGHMSLIMAAEAPGRWAGVSVWAPITDLARWHGETKSAGRTYWENIEAVAGGAPGSSAAVDNELHYRSPLFGLLASATLPPLDLNTGIHDGYTGSVPIHHTLDAFNAIAPIYGVPEIPEPISASLSQRVPGPDSEVQDATYGVRIHLRREAGPSRVTIFEGSHQDIPGAACAWLERAGND